ncbi:MULTISPECIES: nitrogen regulation protein NR(I) [unclassified Colwellia]|uniref:nitrogen regulation protein NR(I) n=1 Tax=unclassified Colwellia TaxID=196834 RepID=UPI0015F5B119|nr:MULTISPECIES: nitrogen regulation protein NR(I) [unclassified Colwellia]MBA6223403.1 nitrogen regulation protein NR(I) [Colwellia sp. MB3u-45]MBA6267928.1 nitrogen regulation protein NR(I) [Colwellia sp. MB3u-43]MBA6287745.1 nitrogen regulation protein NR(I) [Colwellia sp. MB3u-4]MBA6321587.1 nitrogen regulation protein NR(I) [Colwellia sp. MB02u-19]MBA6325414.1 nitrogen regulation protein NR(I) [Colwellia sp. MB02u-18]
MITEQVWIVDDDSSIRWVLEKALSNANISVGTFHNPEDLLIALEHHQPEVIISDIRMPNIDGMTLLGKINDQFAHIPVIIMTAHSDLDSAVNAYQGGAFEYLPKPFDIADAVTLAKRALTHARELKSTKQLNIPSVDAVGIIGAAPSMQEVFRTIGRLSRSSISVLINGESGTGKELVAHALHMHSPRSSAPFIPLNMAAIPKDLIESELFGHEKGAFTGASAVRHGRFEQAHQGTLFLDEIGDMPLDIQTRLLRVLSDGQFYRVGGHSPIKVDVRIIAATHQNLEERVSSSDFREDLFHRLNVIRIQIPSLRERKEDINQLAQHFLKQAAKELAVEIKTLHKSTLDYLEQCEWPGNVRQLENICRFLTVMASGKEILMSDLPSELTVKPLSVKNSHDSWQDNLKTWLDKELSSGKSNIIEQVLPEFEKILLESALKYTQGHKQEAAKRLGWGRNTLTRKLKELNLPD